MNSCDGWRVVSAEAVDFEPYFPFWYYQAALIEAYRKKLVEPKLADFPMAPASAIADGLQFPPDTKEYRLANIRLEAQTYLMEDLTLAVNDDIRKLLVKLLHTAPNNPIVKDSLGRAFADPTVEHLLEMTARAKEELAEGLRFSKGDELVVAEKLEGNVYFDADPSDLDADVWPKLLGLAMLCQSAGWPSVYGFLGRTDLPKDISFAIDATVVRFSWKRSG